MKKILIVAIFFLTAGFAGAQTAQLSPDYQPSASVGYMPSSYYSFSWNTTFPMGDFHKWVSQPSPAGFDFGGRYLLMNGWTAGFNIGWQRVAKIYDDETFTNPAQGTAITAQNYRFTWMVPFQAVIGKHFMPEKLISPYVSLGVGGDYMEHHLLIQEYDIYEDRWDFSLTPEVGAVVKFGAYSNWGGLVAFNYKWTTSKIEIYEDKSQNLQMLNLRVGIVAIIR